MRSDEEIARDAADKFFYVREKAGVPVLWMHTGERHMGDIDPRCDCPESVLRAVRQDAYEAFLAVIRESKAKEPPPMPYSSRDYLKQRGWRRADRTQQGEHVELWCKDSDIGVTLRSAVRRQRKADMEARSG